MLSCKNINENKATDVTQESSDSTQLKISLAQWSFHKALNSGKMDHLQFAEKAGAMGFEGIEYVNQFFKDKVLDTSYLNQMTTKANAAGVKQLLIMIDGEGHLGDPDATKRNEAVLNHHKWVDAAAFLGCHSIRVNAHGEGAADDVANAAVDGLSKLADYASSKNINVIVENHGGYSSNGKWLAGVMSRINKPNCGTLPDFGNFCLKSEKDAKGDTKCMEEYDRYKGVEELMPFAKAVSAKSFDFGELGFETTIDYTRMIDIVKQANYSGFIGVEYEGTVLSEEDGVKATKMLIENCIKELSAKSE
jgi:sugar phosphate isomerase/epimerase